MVNCNDVVFGLVYVIDICVFLFVVNYDISMVDKVIEYVDELFSGYKEDVLKVGVIKVESYIEYGFLKIVIIKEVVKVF